MMAPGVSREYLPGTSVTRGQVFGKVIGFNSSRHVFIHTIAFWYSWVGARVTGHGGKCKDSSKIGDQEQRG